MYAWIYDDNYSHKCIQSQILNREKKKIETEAQAPHRIIENNEGRKEQDPAWWIEATSKSIKSVISKSNINPTQIKAIGISGQQHGFVPLDKNGDVIRPAKLWNDTETAEQAKKLTEKLGGRKRVINLIGNSIAAGYTASKILWLKENEPENYQKMATIMLPHDYLNFWLTGEKKMEFGDASGTAYFDVNNLLDEEYASFGVLSGFPVEPAFYPSPERNFLVGVRLGY